MISLRSGLGIIRCCRNRNYRLNSEQLLNKLYFALIFEFNEITSYQIEISHLKGTEAI